MTTLIDPAPMLRAITNKDVAEVRRLLPMYTDLDQFIRKASGWSVAITLLLIERGANPTTRGQFGHLPIVSAANSLGDEATALLPYYTAADLNRRDDWGETVLHMAATGHDCPTLIRMLLEAGADPHIIAHNGQNALFAAAQACQMGNFKVLLPHYHPWELDIMCWIDTEDDKYTYKDTATPLHIAAFYGDQHMVDLLVAAGANPNMRNSRGETPAKVAESVDRAITFTRK